MAISDADTLGVDIEAIRPEWDWQPVAGLYLDADRLARLVDASRGGGQEDFLRFWTLREAFSKASGSGIVCSSRKDVSSARLFDLAESASRKGAALALPGWKWFQRRQRAANYDVITAIAARSNT